MNKYHVYILKAANLYKIGIAVDVERRMKQLSLSPIPITCTLAVLVDNARKIERQLHLKFDKKREIGEWFLLSDDDLQYIKSYLLTVGVFYQPTRERSVPFLQSHLRLRKSSRTFAVVHIPTKSLGEAINHLESLDQAWSQAIADSLRVSMAVSE